MRISDWSSDVCSSDLNRPEWLRHGHLYGWICSGRVSGCSGAGNVAPDRSFLLQSRGGQCWKHRQRNSAWRGKPLHSTYADAVKSGTRNRKIITDPFPVTTDDYGQRKKTWTYYGQEWG